MASDEKLRRKVWKTSETKLFLKCYLERKDEFIHSRKKRNAYANVLEDMIELGYTDESTTIVTLESKMRTLLVAYKCAKTNGNGKGVASCVTPFMKELEEIFGDSVLVDNDHTLCLGISQPETLMDKLPLSPQTTSSPQSPTSAHQSPPQSPSSLLQPTQENSRRRKSAREKYYEQKIKIKIRLAKEKLEEKRRFHNSIVETIRDIELKKLEILKNSLSS